MLCSSKMWENCANQAINRNFLRSIFNFSRIIEKYFFPILSKNTGSWWRIRVWIRVRIRLWVRVRVLYTVPIRYRYRFWYMNWLILWIYWLINENLMNDYGCGYGYYVPYPYGTGEKSKYIQVEKSIRKRIARAASYWRMALTEGPLMYFHRT